MAGPRTNSNGQIQTAKKEPQTLAGMLQGMGPELEKAVPKHVRPERMLRIALTTLRMNKDLARCTPASFLGSVMSAAQLGLEIGGPFAQAYLIPYKQECTLIVSYRGMLELARRSGVITAIYAYDVREGDSFRYQLGLDPNIDHVPSEDPDRESKSLTHVYAVAKLKDGEPIFTVLTRAQVEKYRGRSRAKASGPWVTDYTAMALKTAVRRLFTWLPQSTEMALGAALDEAPEFGSQAAAWDPQVTDALARHGVEPPALDAPGEQAPDSERDQEQHDPETGEAPMREPGEEG